MKASSLFIYLGTMYVSVHIEMLIKKRDIFDKSLKFSGKNCSLLNCKDVNSHYFSQFCITHSIRYNLLCFTYRTI